MKLLFKTSSAKLVFELGRSVFPECCAVLLSNDRGLGRSLGYVGHVGRNQISLLVMLHAALVHKLAYELFREPLHTIVVQKLPFNKFLELLHETVAQPVPSEAIS